MIKFIILLIFNISINAVKEKVDIDSEVLEESFLTLTEEFRRINIPDRDIYESDLKDKKIHEGKITYPNGNQYVGDLKDKKIHEGKITYPNGNQYVGDLKDGKIQGKSKLTYANGHKYVGEYKDGMMHGEGVFTYASGHKYVGNFENDMMHGKGIYTYVKGSVYEGEFKDGMRNGEGRFTYANGHKYVGEYKDGMMHGEGIFTYASGHKYLGNFENDMMHGKGKFISSDHTFFEGVYNNDLPVVLDKVTIIENKANGKKSIEHHISFENNKYYYYKQNRMKELINIENEKRLRETLLSFGSSESIHLGETYSNIKEFKSTIEKMQKEATRIIKAIRIPEHVFTILIENQQVYIFDNGAMESSFVDSVSKGVEYIKVPSSKTLSFSLNNHNIIEIKLNTKNKDQYCCKHLQNTIYLKLKEFQENKSKLTIIEQFKKYLSSQKDKKIRPNSVIEEI